MLLCPRWNGVIRSEPIVRRYTKERRELFQDASAWIGHFVHPELADIRQIEATSLRDLLIGIRLSAWSSDRPKEMINLGGDEVNLVLVFAWCAHACARGFGFLANVRFR